MRSPRRNHGRSRPRTARRRALRRFTLFTLIPTILFLAGSAYWRNHSRHSVVRRGLELLSRVGGPDRIEQRLEQWERETGATWREDPKPLVARLLSDYPLEDARIRILLSHLTGCDYGERRADWLAWGKESLRLEAGEQPRASGRHAVKLEKRWTAPIGLTTWNTTIIPIDGSIFIASSGSSVANPSDPGDGVVRVDGETGRASLIFRLPDGRSRGVVGISAGSECLFVAGDNSFVYAITREGALKWKTGAAAAIACPPLTIDVNRDGTLDVIVATRANKIVAINGRQGRTFWVARLPQSSAVSQHRMRTRPALSVGDVVGSSRPELLVTTPDGHVVCINVANGETLWQRGFTAEFYAGAIALDPQRYDGLRGLGVTRDGRVWTLVGERRSARPVEFWRLPMSAAANVVAGPRVIAPYENGLPRPLILISVGSTSRARGDGICAITSQGVAWRYRPGGNIWATPAVADLNRDRKPDIVVLSTQSSGDGRPHGLMSIISAEGHCLYRLRFDAGLECPPVVADVDGDHRLDILVADRAGRLHCFATHSPGPIEWGLPLGDAHNTQNAENAYAYGQTPVGFQWRWRPSR